MKTAQIDRIKRQTQCGECLFANWQASNEYFWCDKAAAKINQPVWHCEDDCRFQKLPGRDI